MEKFQLDYSQDSFSSDISQQIGNTITTSTQDEQISKVSEFYDESGNYKLDAFENLGGLHYMNYLHSHDDML